MANLKENKFEASLVCNKCIIQGKQYLCDILECIMAGGTFKKLCKINRILGTKLVAIYPASALTQEKTEVKKRSCERKASKSLRKGKRCKNG